MNDTIRHYAIGLLVKKATPVIGKVTGEVANGVAKGVSNGLRHTLRSLGEVPTRRPGPSHKAYLKAMMFRGQLKNRALAAWDRDLEAARKSSAEFAKELEKATQAGQLGTRQLSKRPLKLLRGAEDKVYIGPRKAYFEISDLKRSGYIQDYPKEVMDAYNRHAKNMQALKSSSREIREAVNPDFSHYDLGKGPIMSGIQLDDALKYAPEELSHTNWKNVDKWRARLG